MSLRRQRKQQREQVDSSSDEGGPSGDPSLSKVESTVHQSVRKRDEKKAMKEDSRHPQLESKIKPGTKSPNINDHPISSDQLNRNQKLSEEARRRKVDDLLMLCVHARMKKCFPAKESALDRRMHDFMAGVQWDPDVVKSGLDQNTQTDIAGNLRKRSIAKLQEDVSIFDLEIAKTARLPSD